MSKRYFIIRDCNKLPLRRLDRIDGLASWGVWTLQCCQELVWFALGPAQERCLFCFYSRGVRETGTPWRCGRELYAEDAALGDSSPGLPAGEGAV